MATLAPEAIVWVTGRLRDRDWLRVGYNQTSGYVSASLLQEIDAGEAAAWSQAKAASAPGELERFLTPLNALSFKLIVRRGFGG